jgi:hypothetical protein
MEKKHRADPKMTRLKSIAGIGIGDINQKQLGTSYSCNGITGVQSIDKDLVCKKIVTFVFNMEQMQAGTGVGGGTSGAFQLLPGHQCVGRQANETSRPSPGATYVKR